MGPPIDCIISGEHALTFVMSTGRHACAAFLGGLLEQQRLALGAHNGKLGGFGGACGIVLAHLPL